jgi:flagellar biogenesis protein FliO
MAHYLTNFILATLSVIGFLLLIYAYLKKNPSLLPTGPSTPSNPSGTGLQVESALALEPRKNLYVIRYGSQRVLVSTTMDKIEYLTTLESEPDTTLCETALAEQVDEGTVAGLTTGSNYSSSPSPLSPNAGFKERFHYSLKLILADRFKLGGK